MSPIKSSLLVALATVVVTAGGLYWFNQDRNREAAKLRRQNNQMRVQAMLRQHELQRVVPAETSVAGVAAEEVNAEPALPPPPPKSAYRNEGTATPRATLQTFAWACDQGDVETVQKLIYIDEAAGKKAEMVLAAMPHAQRQQWPTVEAMAAALYTQQVMEHPFPNAEVLDELTIESLGEDRAMLRSPVKAKDRTEYQKTADGWKMAITERMVDSYIKHASQAAAKP